MERYDWNELKAILDSTGKLWNLSAAARITGLSDATVARYVNRHAPDHPRLPRGGYRPRKECLKTANEV